MRSSDAEHKSREVTEAYEILINSDKRERYDRLGANCFIFRIQWPGMEQDKVLRSIRLLGEQVLPHLR